MSGKFITPIQIQQLGENGIGALQFMRSDFLPRFLQALCCVGREWPAYRSTGQWTSSRSLQLQPRRLPIGCAKVLVLGFLARLNSSSFLIHRSGFGDDYWRKDLSPIEISRIGLETVFLDSFAPGVPFLVQPTLFDIRRQPNVRSLRLAIFYCFYLFIYLFRRRHG